MCDFCNNSGKRVETIFNSDEQSEGNFQLLIYGNNFLRINATECDNHSSLKSITGLRPASVEINYCPFCGRKLK